MLKKVLTYFETLIVPHALHCVDSSIFCILPHLTQSDILFWFQCPPPPPPPPLLSPFPNCFIKFGFGLLFTASTSPRQRPYGEGILLSYARILPHLRCSCLLLSFEESKAWCFKCILCLAEDSLETSSLISSEKQWKILMNVICCSHD